MQLKLELKSWRKRTKLLMLAVLSRQPLKGHHLDPAHLKGASSLRKCAKPLFNPPKSPNKKKGNLVHFSGNILSLFFYKFSSKHIRKPLISLFFQQSRGSVLALFFLSMVLGPWIWGFKGVDVTC